MQMIGKRATSELSVGDDQELKRHKTSDEPFELKNLPCASQYEKSYMHREQVSHI
jgi:hypothetical protein